MPALFSRIDHRNARWTHCECQLCNPTAPAQPTGILYVKEPGDVWHTFAFMDLRHARLAARLIPWPAYARAGCAQ